jgi:hypothetical protein
MEINYCLKKGKGKGNLYLPSFVVTLFCRRALMSSRSYVAALLCRRALMSPRSYVARSFVARFCRDTVPVHHNQFHTASSSTVSARVQLPETKEGWTV